MNAGFPSSFEIKSGVDKNGRACMIVTFDSALIDKYVSELASCFVQASFIPEVEMHSSSNGQAWHYDIVNRVNSEGSKFGVHIEKLQEELIGVIAMLSIERAQARTPNRSAATKRSSNRRPPARKLKAL
jgi:hypothetical protein